MIAFFLAFMLIERNVILFMICYSNFYIKIKTENWNYMFSLVFENECNIMLYQTMKKNE